MRTRVSSGGVTVNAIAGTHVVMLGFDLSSARRKGCLGFAIQREDSRDGERIWLRGMKAFEATDPGLGLGGTAPSSEQPFQTFQWADYSVYPGVRYRYAVTPVYGTPEDLDLRSGVTVTVSTEPELGPEHSVFFNRGSAASQEYARRFGDRTPEEVGVGAYRWLSRGLYEALCAYVARAKDSSWGVYAAIYEFQWPGAVQAFADAKKRGAAVEVVYDDISAKGPGKKNTKAVKDAGLTSVCVNRTRGTIMHNKFIVLTKNGKPGSVWLGSTNLTENGIFGHSNVGHIIEDPAIAQQYLDYWVQITADETGAKDRAWNDANNPNPPEAGAPKKGASRAVFSPRKGLSVLDWYASIADRKNAPLFMTFAFGMHSSFLSVYEQRDGVLRMALMEKEGNGKQLAQGKIDIARVRKLPNVVVSIGHSITMNRFDRWVKELDAVSGRAHVKYVHDKFMLSDPLGSDPIVVTGSANFSKASTDSNHENMLVIRGDRRVADIYLGEYMRLFSHYSFREAVANAKKWNSREWKPQFLIPDDSWQRDYFRRGSQRDLRRRYFAG